MNKRAIWIFDKNYMLLTYLSVRSFRHSAPEIPLTLIICDDSLDSDDLMIFEELDGIEIKLYSPPNEHWEVCQMQHIKNRLARFYALSLYPDDIVMLMDSDVVFNDFPLSEIKDIEEKIKDLKIGCVCGVVENKRAIDGYLYFNKTNKRGDAIKVPEYTRTQVLDQIFGSEWERLTGAFQFNNGFLVFYQCQELIEIWEEYYLKGLQSEFVNPADDQLPLSAAICNTQFCNIKLDQKWNSLGKSSGDYLVFHLWAGRWKNALSTFLTGSEIRSRSEEIIKRYWYDIPPTWLANLQGQLKVTPFKYKTIDGWFDHENVYRDIVELIENGHIVEIGTYKGRSACFMAECIKNSGKSIQFDTIDHFRRSDTNSILVKKNLTQAGVDSYANVKSGESVDLVDGYSDDSLEFIFYDGDSKTESFPLELELWYNKLKPDGMIAGYDYSIHDTVNMEYGCVSQEFALSNHLAYRTYKNRFFIKKKNTKEA